MKKKKERVIYSPGCHWRWSAVPVDVPGRIFVKKCNKCGTFYKLTVILKGHVEIQPAMRLNEYMKSQEA